MILFRSPLRGLREMGMLRIKKKKKSCRMKSHGARFSVPAYAARTNLSKRALLRRHQILAARGRMDCNASIHKMTTWIEPKFCQVGGSDDYNP